MVDKRVTTLPDASDTTVDVGGIDVWVTVDSVDVRRPRSEVENTEGLKTLTVIGPQVTRGDTEVSLVGEKDTVKGTVFWPDVSVVGLPLPVEKGVVRP